MLLLFPLRYLRCDSVVNTKAKEITKLVVHSITDRNGELNRRRIQERTRICEYLGSIYSKFAVRCKQDK